jgi:hypothetical protein
MRGGEIRFRANRYDAVRIDGLVAGVIVPADVIEVHGLDDAGWLKQIPGVTREIGIVNRPAQITFEMAEINGIEANEGGEETPVGFNGPIAKQVAGPRQAILKLVEHGKDVAHGGNSPTQLFMRKTRSRAAAKADCYLAALRWSQWSRAWLLRFGLTARVGACRPLLARSRLARQGRQRFGLLEIDAGSFADTPAIIFIPCGGKQRPRDRKRADQCRGKDQNIGITWKRSSESKDRVSYCHLNNTRAMNQYRSGNNKTWHPARFM